MVQQNIPKCLWNYGLTYIAKLTLRTAQGMDNQSDIEQITGQTADVLEWMDFEFYD